MSCFSADGGIWLSELLLQEGAPQLAYKPNGKHVRHDTAGKEEEASTRCLFCALYCSEGGPVLRQ